MTRWGDFWKFLATNFYRKVAQISGNVLAYFDVSNFLRQNCFYYFRQIWTWLNRWKFRGREISRRREMKKITCCQMQKSWWKIWGKIPNYPRNFYWNSIIPIEISLNYFAGYFLKGKILPRNFYKVTWYNNSDWNFAEIFCSRWQHFGEHFRTKFVSEILIKCAFYFGRNFAEIFCRCSNLAQ